MNKIQKIESRLLRVIKRCLRNWKRKQKKKQVRKSRKRVRTRREIQTRKTSGKVAQRKTGKTGSQHRQSQARRKNERKIQHIVNRIHVNVFRLRKAGCSGILLGQ